MANPTSPGVWVEREAKEALARTGPWIERAARVGYTAKALIYVIVGAMASRAALGDGGRTMGSREALELFRSKPFGSAVLLTLAAGLIGYACWRLVEAVFDPDGRGRNLKGIALRLSFAGRGILHGALGVTAARLAFGQPTRNTDATREWTGKAMHVPFGKWIVVAVGLSIIGYGVYQIYRAVVAKLSKQLDLSRLTWEAGHWVIGISRFGIGARGVVFGIIGILLVRAGWQHDSTEAGGAAQALEALARQPFGSWLLGTVAVGLIAYGLYEIVQARYRRIDAQP